MQRHIGIDVRSKSCTVAVVDGNNYVLNPSFEADRVTTSTPAGWTVGGGTNASGGHTGRWSWQLAGSLDQAITGLPDGTYTLSVWAKSASGTLYGKACGGPDQSMALSAASSWSKVSLPGIAVSGGVCKVGVSSAGGNVDDFTLNKN
jgi:hypothetical protein